jgi:predicted DNA-binding transcriptional regulator AlpA
MKQQYIRISDLATTAEKNGRLPVSPATIWRWIREGRFPAPFKLGKNVTVWDADVIDQFLAAQAVEGQ